MPIPCIHISSGCRAASFQLSGTSSNIFLFGSPSGRGGGFHFFPLMELGINFAICPPELVVGCFRVGLGTVGGAAGKPGNAPVNCKHSP